MIKMMSTVVARSIAKIPNNSQATDIFAVISDLCQTEETALLSFTEKLKESIDRVREKRGNSNYGKCEIEFTAINYTPLWVHVADERTEK